MLDQELAPLIKTTKDSYGSTQTHETQVNDVWELIFSFLGIKQSYKVARLLDRKHLRFFHDSLINKPAIYAQELAKHNSPSVGHYIFKEWLCAYYRNYRALNAQMRLELQRERVELGEAYQGGREDQIATECLYSLCHEYDTANTVSKKLVLGLKLLLLAASLILLAVGLGLRLGSNNSQTEKSLGLGLIIIGGIGLGLCIVYESTKNCVTTCSKINKTNQLEQKYNKQLFNQLHQQIGTTDLPFHLQKPITKQQITEILQQTQDLTKAFEIDYLARRLVKEVLPKTTYKNREIADLSIELPGVKF